MLDFISILEFAGFDPKPRTKMVRHQDPTFELDLLRRNGRFERYQATQRKPVFDGLEQLVSFYGLPGTRAAFFGVYKVGESTIVEGTEGVSGPLRYRSAESRIFYRLERDTRFDFLQNRLIVGWSGARNWVQNLKSLEVLEIRAPGRKLLPFTDYLEFSLTFAELKDLMRSQEAHRDWQSALSAVAGVYLIRDSQSQQLYVGSAYGAEGIWGRWTTYADTHHGGNKKLQELVQSDSRYADNFVFSVLQVLPRTMTKEEVIKKEELYKCKLGTRVEGLNS